MKKIMLITIILTGMLFAFDFSEDTVVSAKLQELIDSVPAHQNFPNASYYIISDSTVVSLTPTGSETEKYFLAKAYTYRGKKRLSNFKINYNADYEEVQLIRARTINDDGVFPVDTMEVNEITPPEYSEATQYVNMTQMVISLPAFAENSVAEIHYKINRKKDCPIPFGGINVLVGEQPARKVCFGLYSKGQNIKYTSISGAPEPKVSGQLIQWTIQNYEGVDYEPNIPPKREIMPTVLYTASRNWTEEAEFIAGMFLPHTIQDENITALAESLAQNKSKMQALTDIFYYIQEKFSRVYLNPNIVGYRPNDANVVLKNGYGDSRDLSVLLISMLRAIKIPAKPALVAINGAKILNFPTVHQFSRVVVMATVENETLFLDPMQQYASPGYLGTANGENAFLISPGIDKLVKVPAIALDKNRVIYRYNFNIGIEREMAGEVITDAMGNPASSIRAMFRHTKKSKKEQKFQNAVSNVADGAKLRGEPRLEGIDKNDGKVVVELSLTAENYLVTQEEMAILWLPNSPFGLVGLPDISLEKRKFPIYTGVPTKVEKNISFTIPAEYEVLYVPPITNIENNVGSLNISSQHSGTSIQINITLAIKSKRVTIEDYEKLKNLIRTISTKKFRLVLMEKKLDQ